MSYTKNFTPTYENGWQGSPATTTPISADALNNYDGAIEYIEDYLEGADFLSKNQADGYYIQDVNLSLTQTLSATDPTTYIFSDSKITADSAVDVYTSIAGINYTGITISTGACTVTFPKQDVAVSMTCKIYLK